MPRVLHHHELFEIQMVGHRRSCSSVAPTVLEIGSIVHLEIARSLARGHRITRGDSCDQVRTIPTFGESSIAGIWVRASRGRPQSS